MRSTDGVPCVRYGDIYTQHQYFIRATRAGITEESAARYTRIRHGDVLFAGSGETLEEIYQVAVNLGSTARPTVAATFSRDSRPSIEADATFFRVRSRLFDQHLRRHAWAVG